MTQSNRATPKPSKLYALTSGGKDSLTLAHYLDSKGMLEACVFLDTGIKAPDLLDFMRTLPYPLEVYKTTANFDDIVRRVGFARPYSHKWYVNYLKGRALNQFSKAHRGEHPVLASGARATESARRATNIGKGGLTKWEGLPVEKPLNDWTTEMVWDYVRRHDLKLSPCYRAIHYSGDCFCGAFAEKREIKMIEMMYPEVAERIHRLEAEVGGVWGSRILPAKRNSKQSTLESFACQECSILQPVPLGVSSHEV